MDRLRHRVYTPVGSSTRALTQDPSEGFFRTAQLTSRTSSPHRCTPSSNRRTERTHSTSGTSGSPVKPPRLSALMSSPTYEAAPLLHADDASAAEAKRSKFRRAAVGIAACSTLAVAAFAGLRGGAPISTSGYALGASPSSASSSALTSKASSTHASVASSAKVPHDSRRSKNEKKYPVAKIGQDLEEEVQMGPVATSYREALVPRSHPRRANGLCPRQRSTRLRRCSRAGSARGIPLGFPRRTPHLLRLRLHLTPGSSPRRNISTTSSTRSWISRTSLISPGRCLLRPPPARQLP